jgi:hypothetical protein
MELFKLKKKTAHGQCEAMRCTESKDDAVSGAPWGVEANVLLCTKHLAMSQDYARKHPEIVPAEPSTALAVYSESMAEGAKIVGWTEQSAVGHWLARVHEVVATLPALTQEGLDVAELVKALTVDSQADLVLVGDWIKEAKAKLKEISADEKEIALPVSTALARIRELCKPAKQAWADAEELLRAQLVAAKLREEERNREVMVEARAAHLTGGDATLALGRLTQTSDIEGVSLKLKWKAVVEDVALMPDEYVVRIPNDKKLKEHCSAAGDEEPAPISGVRFERDVASRVQAAKA